MDDTETALVALSARAPDLGLRIARISEPGHLDDALEFASRALTSIEINGTYYSTFKPPSWTKWRDATPKDFVFAVKASRFCTNRRVLAEAGDSVKRFIGQGLSLLGEKLGPINWQFMGTKKFDPEDFGEFLRLLPKEVDGLPLRLGGRPGRCGERADERALDAPVRPRKAARRRGADIERFGSQAFGIG